MWPHPQCTKETRTNGYSPNNTNYMYDGQKEKLISKQNQQMYNNNNYMRGDINPYDNSMNGFTMYEQVNMNSNRQPQNRDESQVMNRMEQDTYLRSKSSSQHQPLVNNHEHYMMDPYAYQMHGGMNGGVMVDRVQKNTRDIGKMRYNDVPVQQGFQQNYFMSNYETLNEIQRGVPGVTDNILVDRNPVNTRRDMVEKERTEDRKQFMQYQGGNMNAFVDLNPQYTRKERNQINSSSYVPMARTLAIPRDKI